jgi:DNA-binding phage protein
MDRTAFADFFDEQMADPARADAYREARAEIDTYDHFMRAMNALRQSRGVSKAKLASMSGLPAQSVRKVLTDRKANPTIATVFKMLSTMGFGLQVVPLRGRHPRRPTAHPAAALKRPATTARSVSVFAERAAEKQRSRDEDARRLKAGEVTPEQLQAENSFFNFSEGVRIVDFGRPLRRPK